MLFAPTADDADLREQERRLGAAREALVERDVAVVEITRDGGRGGAEERLDEAAANAIRARFEAPSDAFLFVLLGKDGTEKARWNRPVDPRWIAETIDAMPMRQREMRERRTTRGDPPTRAGRLRDRPGRDRHGSE